MKVGFQKDKVDKLTKSGDAAATGAMVAFRTKLLVAEADAVRARAILEENTAKMKNLTRRSDATWDALIEASALAGEVLKKSASKQPTFEERRREMIDRVARAAKRVEKSRANRHKPGPVATACRLLAAAGARYCVDDAKRQFYLAALRQQPREAWSLTTTAPPPSASSSTSPTKKKKRPKAEEDFGPPDSTDRYDEAVATGRLNEILAPLVEEQTTKTMKIQKWVRRLIMKRFILSRPTVVKMIDDRENKRYFEERRARIAAERERDQNEKQLVRLLKLRRDAERRRAAYEKREKALKDSLRDMEVERLYEEKGWSHVKAHWKAFRQFMRAKKFGLGRGARLLRAAARAWRDRAAMLAQERRAARLMQTCWRILQAVAVVRAKKAELARKRRVFNKLYGKAEDRRSLRILWGWGGYAWPRAAAKRLRAASSRRFREKILRSWYRHAKTGPARRQGFVRKLQKGVRKKLSGVAFLVKQADEKKASTALQCWRRQLVATQEVQRLRTLKREREEAKERERKALELRRRHYERWTKDVVFHWGRVAHCERMGAYLVMKRTFPTWKENVEALALEREITRRVASERIARVVRGNITRWRFLVVLRKNRMARRIQSSLARIHLAKGVAREKRTRQDAVTRVQKMRRANVRRQKIRAWNAHELLAAAYANTAKMLVKHHRAAKRVRSLADTDALVVKGPAGDSAIHRAARGVGEHSVLACFRNLGLAADASRGRADLVRALHEDQRRPSRG